MKRIKKDDKGFTLVELLIAIVIIAIVMMPLYSNFRQSTYLNGKAKKTMDATNMASNIMEGMSAYTAEEVILGFYSIDKRTISNNDVPPLNILPNEVELAGASGYGDLDGVSIVTDANGNVTSSSASINLDTVNGLVNSGSGYSYANALYAEVIGGGNADECYAEYLQVKKSSNDKYYFYIQGAKQARGTYDVIVELDASVDSGYSGDQNNDGIIDTASGETTRYNDYESAEITSINPLFDGTYTDSINMKSDAAAYFVTKMRDKSIAVTASDLYPVLERTLTIKLERDTNNFAQITATETYKIINRNGFLLQSSGKTIDTGSAFETTEYTLPSTVIFDGSVYKQEPRDIYIYYMANYESTNTNLLDKFYISNDAESIPINIHLMRLRTNETSDSLEQNYRSLLNVRDMQSDGYQTVIYSNLTDNITKSNAANIAENYRGSSSRCQVSINGNTYMSTSKPAGYDEIIHENGGVKTEVKDRLYSVKLYVYEEGAAAGGFTRDKLLTVFDGSSSQ